MSLERIVALLGRRDEPTDGVDDYCSWLGAARHSIERRNSRGDHGGVVARPVSYLYEREAIIG